MQRRSTIQISSLIILLSIVTILVQFVIYYLFSAFYIILGVSILITALCCYFITEQTSSFEACFHYSVLNLFISSVIILLSYSGKEYSLLPYTGIMLGIAIINWLIPCIYCFLRNMFDYGSHFEDYPIFYRNDSILFFAIYLSILLYATFSKDAFPFAYIGSLDSANFIPFEAITIQIEDLLYDITPLSDIITYLLCRILIFIPYGFQMTLLLRRQGRLIRLAVMLGFPLLLEVFQYFFLPYRCDIDDVFYALIGGLLGTALYYLCNLIYRALTGKDFMAGGYSSYSRSELHF